MRCFDRSAGVALVRERPAHPIAYHIASASLERDKCEVWSISEQEELMMIPIRSMVQLGSLHFSLLKHHYKEVKQL